MVLLVLALAWATVLFFWIRSRSKDTFGDSVGLFHRHLNVLERTAPVGFAAANRLRVPDPTFASPRRQAAGIGTGLPRAVAPRGTVARGSSAQLLAQARRRQSRRRRRDVLAALVIVAAVTLLIAGITRSAAVITLQIATDLALFGYMALLVQLRNVAAEREAKVRFMHPQGRPARQSVAQVPLAPGMAAAQMPVAQMAPGTAVAQMPMAVGMAQAAPAPAAVGPLTAARTVRPSAADAFYAPRAVISDAYTYVAEEDPSGGYRDYDYGYIEPEPYQAQGYEAQRYEAERYEAQGYEAQRYESRPAVAAHRGRYEPEPSYQYEPYELDTAQYAAAGY
ncbi:MAG TPA: hypothetical protein VKV06_08095 [Acidimicrobiales bacterium]|nr:hypothetical protein [Acidimicrobiales bacterium]